MVITMVITMVDRSWWCYVHIQQYFSCCQAQTKAACQSPAGGWVSLIITTVRNHHIFVKSVLKDDNTHIDICPSIICPSPNCDLPKQNKMMLWRCIRGNWKKKFYKKSSSKAVLHLRLSSIKCCLLSNVGGRPLIGTQVSALPKNKISWLSRLIQTLFSASSFERYQMMTWLQELKMEIYWRISRH